MEHTILRVLLCLAGFSALVWSGPTPKVDAETTPLVRLQGTAWHTAHIDGDALFFVVKEIGIRFEADGRFAARVEFIDGQRASKTGTYRVDADRVFVSIAGNPQTKEIQYWTDGPNLIVRDKAFDVTARLAPGQMEESWF